MANGMYGKGREKFLTADIDWLVDDIKVVLVDAADYTVAIDADEFLSDIPAPARVATSGNLAGKTATLGVADADDVNVLAVTGDQFEYVVLYKDTGSAATSPLICIFDTAVGLAYTPNGGNITITWDTGANRIFKL